MEWISKAILSLLYMVMYVLTQEWIDDKCVFEFIVHIYEWMRVCIVDGTKAILVFIKI